MCDVRDVISKFSLILPFLNIYVIFQKYVGSRADKFMVHSLHWILNSWFMYIKGNCIPFKFNSVKSKDRQEIWCRSDNLGFIFKRFHEEWWYRTSDI